MLHLHHDHINSFSSYSSRLLSICLISSLCFVFSGAEIPLSTDLKPAPIPPFSGNLELEGMQLPIAQKDVPAGVIIFNGDDIRKSGLLDLTDFLSRQPNLSILRYANRPGGVSKTFMQSASAGDIAVYMDDIQANSLYGGFPDLSRIPLENIEHVEVWPAGSAALNGANAAGGMIRVITKRGRLESAKSWLNFNDSTFDRERYKLDFGNTVGPLDFRFGGSRELSSGWQWNGRTRMSNISTWVKAFPDDPIRLTVAFDRFGRYQQLPGSIAEEEIYADDTFYQDEVRYDLEGKLEWEYRRDHKLSLQYQWGQDERILVLPPIVIDPDLPLTPESPSIVTFNGSRDLGFRHKAILNWEYQYGASGLLAETGADFYDSSGAARRTQPDTSTSLLHYRGQSSEPWVRTLWLFVPNNWLTITPAARFGQVADQWRLDGGLDLAFIPTPGMMIYARGGSNYHRALPREQIVCAYSAISAQVGGEVGLRFRHPWRGEAGLSVYMREETNRPEDDNYYINKKAHLTGAGLWFTINPWIPDLLFTASAGIDDPKGDNNHYLPMIPRERVHTRIDYSLGFFEGDLRLGVAAETDFVGRRSYLLANVSPWYPEYGQLGTYNQVNMMGYMQLLQARAYANFYNVTNHTSHVIIPGYKTPGYELAIGFSWQLLD